MGAWNLLDGCYVLPLPRGELVISARVTGRIKARYEEWLEANAFKRVNKLKSQLSPAEARSAWRNVIGGTSFGLFTWGGEAWQDSMRETECVAHLVFLLAQSSGRMNGVTEDVVLDFMFDPAELGEVPEGEDSYRSADAICDVLREVMKADQNFHRPPSREDRA